MAEGRPASAVDSPRVNFLSARGGEQEPRSGRRDDDGRRERGVCSADLESSLQVQLNPRERIQLASVESAQGSSFSALQ